MKNKYTYKGEDIDYLSKEKLIDIVGELIDQLQNERYRFNKGLKLLNDMHKVGTG